MDSFWNIFNFRFKIYSRFFCTKRRTSSMYWLEMSVWTRNCNKHRCPCFWCNNQINRNEPTIISMLDWAGFIFNVNLRFLQWEFYKKYSAKIFGNYRWCNSHFTCNKILIILGFNNSFSNQLA